MSDMVFVLNKCQQSFYIRKNNEVSSDPDDCRLSSTSASQMIDPQWPQLSVVISKSSQKL